MYNKMTGGDTQKRRWTKTAVLALMMLSISSSPRLAAAQTTPDITKDPGWPLVSSYFQSGDSALGCSKTVLTSTGDRALTEFSGGVFYACQDGVVSRCKASSSAAFDGIPCYQAPTLTFRSNGDNEHWVYADGVEIGHGNDWTVTLTVTVPSPTKVIAVKIVDYGVVGGLLGSFSDGTITDGSWKCTRTLFNDWNLPTYDDSAWPAAVATRGQGDPTWGTRPLVAANAKWIWNGQYGTSGSSVTVYCRKTINYAPLTFKSNGDNEHWVYGDGLLLGHANDWTTTLTVIVPSPTQVLAVKINDYGVVGGLLGSFSDGKITDGTWKCTRTFYEGWNSPAYDDSAWPVAVATRGQGDPTWGTRPLVAASAKWIWNGQYPTSGSSVTVYCRKRINYCVPQPIEKCSSYQCNVSPVSVLCFGKLVKVVQLPQYNLFQTCNTVKCRQNCDSCGCGRCVASKTTCNLLVYWPTTTGALGYRFCPVPVPGCCNSQCYGVPSL